ncbi:MAG: hypothetical protein Q9180_008436 [Flavoplaca navasiana]
MNGSNSSWIQANQLSDRQAGPSGYNLEPEDIVEDYLTPVRNLFEAILRITLPSSITSTSIEYVVTVPAIWSHLAIKRMKEYAKRAGMGEVRIVTEPELVTCSSPPNSHPSDCTTKALTHRVQKLRAVPSTSTSGNESDATTPAATPAKAPASTTKKLGASPTKKAPADGKGKGKAAAAKDKAGKRKAEEMEKQEGSGSEHEDKKMKKEDGEEEEEEEDEDEEVKNEV